MGDLVLRRVLSREGLHKLSPMWEGPFKVVHLYRPGAARLETQDGVPIYTAWNIQHHRKYYPEESPSACEEGPSACEARPCAYEGP